MIGTGGGALAVMDEVKREAKRRKIELLILPTSEAIEILKSEPARTNAILHLIAETAFQGAWDPGRRKD